MLVGSWGPVWFQDLPDPHAVSSSIQQMWALTEVMQTQQTNASIGRFDVSQFYFWRNKPPKRQDGGRHRLAASINLEWLRPFIS